MPARPRPRPRHAFVVTTAAASLALACGGALEDEGGSGGLVGAGGSAGSGTGGSSGWGGSTNPPDPCWGITAASVGQACVDTGAQCLVSQCFAPLWQSDLLIACAEGRWTSMPAASCNPPPPPACPELMPAQGEPCALPEGASCDYGGNQCCPPETALCEGGAWTLLYISCNPPPPECPVEVPVPGASCAPSDPCGMTWRTCDYATPECPVQATCGDTLTWSVTGCAADAGAGG